MNPSGWRRKRLGDSVAKQRKIAALEALAQPGEKVVLHWAQDCAIGCTCEPHLFATLDCISIARGPGYDRCLGCGARWTSRNHRWEPAKAITAEAITAEVAS